MNYEDDFTSNNGGIIRVNSCEQLVDVTSEIKLINDWVDKDVLIQVNQTIKITSGTSKR